MLGTLHRFRLISADLHQTHINTIFRFQQKIELVQTILSSFPTPFVEELSAFLKRPDLLVYLQMTAHWSYTLAIRTDPAIRALTPDRLDEEYDVLLPMIDECNFPSRSELGIPDERLPTTQKIMAGYHSQTIWEKNGGALPPPTAKLPDCRFPSICSKDSEGFDDDIPPGNSDQFRREFEF